MTEKSIIIDGNSTTIDDRIFDLDTLQAAQALATGKKVEVNDDEYDWEDGYHSSSSILYPEDFAGLTIAQIRRHLCDYYTHNLFRVL